jgi:hypothetical protein
MTDGADAGREGGFWTPRPDPTVLTTEAVTRATDIFRREVANLREILETRLDGNDDQRALLWKEVHDWPAFLETRLERRRREFEDDLASIKELLEQRMAAMDKAIELAVRELDKQCGILRDERESKAEAEREYMMSQLGTVSSVMAEKFSAVDGRFEESKVAVDAAFAAAKEAVAEQNKSNAREIGKSETATKEQLASLSRVTDAGIAGLSDKISDARDRLTAIENLTRGIEQAGGVVRQDRGLRTSTVSAAIAAVAVLVAIISTLLYVVKK